MIVVCILLIAIIGVAVFSIIEGNKPKAQQKTNKEKRQKMLYNFIAKSFLTSEATLKIQARLSALTIFKRKKIEELTFKYLCISWGATITISALGFILYSDVVSRLLCVAFAFVVGKFILNKQLDRQYFKVIKAMALALSMVRQEYMRSEDIVVAIGEAEIPDILKKPFDTIYSILTSANGEVKMQAFYESTPFRALQTFVSICYNVNNQGDTKNKHGASNFVQALTVLLSDVNADILRLTSQKQKFGIIEYLPFIPIVGAPLIEGYFVGIMPGTVIIYGGPIGHICKAVMLILSIICYAIVAGINMSNPIKPDDREEWVMNLLVHPKLKRIVRNITPKTKKIYKLNRLIKESLTRQTVDQIYMKKLVYGFGTIVGVIIVTISTITLGSEFTRNCTTELSLTATNDMDGFTKKSILAMDEKYMEQRDALQPEEDLKTELAAIVKKLKQALGLLPKEEKQGIGGGGKYPDVSDDAKAALVQAYMPGLTDLQVIDQGKRMADKYESLKNIGFKWYYVWLWLLAGFFGFSIPELQLKLRKVMVKTEAEDDFLQLQTLVSIFMTTDMDVLDILNELSRNSKVHKDMLLYCYHSYPSNPELELDRLKSKTPLNEFKRFIGKLKLTINDLSMEEAFSDLIIEREQIMRIRELTIEATVARKRSLCGILSLIPLGAMVLSQLLLPLGIVGYKGFKSALDSMN